MKTWIVSSLDEESIQGEETNQGRKLYEEIRYMKIFHKTKVQTIILRCLVLSAKFNYMRTVWQYVDFRWISSKNKYFIRKLKIKILVWTLSKNMKPTFETPWITAKLSALAWLTLQYKNHKPPRFLQLALLNFEAPPC